MSGEREKLAAAMGERSCTCHPSEAPVPCERRYALTECLIAAAARRLERERCRDRINALIEAHVAMSERYQTVPGRRWYEARIATLMAARSAVMRGDDGG